MDPRSLLHTVFSSPFPGFVLKIFLLSGHNPFRRLLIYPKYMKLILRDQNVLPLEEKEFHKMNFRKMSGLQADFRQWGWLHMQIYDARVVVSHSN